MASGSRRFDRFPRQPCTTAPSPRARMRRSTSRTHRGLTPNSFPACTCVMCRFLTASSTFNRSRSFLVIHSSSGCSAMPYQSGTFYLAPRGTSHVAATPPPPPLTTYRLPRYHSSSLLYGADLGFHAEWLRDEP